MLHPPDDFWGVSDYETSALFWLDKPETILNKICWYNDVFLFPDVNKIMLSHTRVIFFKRVVRGFYSEFILSSKV